MIRNRDPNKVKVAEDAFGFVSSDQEDEASQKNVKQENRDSGEEEIKEEKDQRSEENFDDLDEFVEEMQKEFNDQLANGHATPDDEVRDKVNQMTEILSRNDR